MEAYTSRTACRPWPSNEDLTSVADQLTKEGTPVELLGSVFVPEEETCFYLFEAQSSESVMEAARRCGLRYERVAKAISPWTGVRGRNPSKETP